MAEKMTAKQRHEQLSIMLSSTWRQIVKEEIENTCKELEALMYRDIKAKKYEYEYAEVDLYAAKYDMLKKILERPEEIVKTIKWFIDANT